MSQHTYLRRGGAESAYLEELRGIRLLGEDADAILRLGVTERSQNFLVVSRAVVVQEQNDWPHDRAVSCEHLCNAARRDLRIKTLEVVEERHASLHPPLTPRDVDEVASLVNNGNRVVERLEAFESVHEPRCGVHLAGEVDLRSVAKAAEAPRHAD